MSYERAPEGFYADPGYLPPCCYSCRYWTRLAGRIHSESDAECRRYAPRPVLAPATGEVPNTAEWPVTDGGDWCGDHAPLPPGVDANEAAWLEPEPEPEP